MDLFSLHFNSRWTVFVLLRVVITATVALGVLDLVVKQAQAAQQNMSIERNMMNLGVPPLPTTTPPARSAADREKLKAQLEEVKRDAAALAELANSLKSELAKANEDVMAVNTAEKATQIEKLAKKIKRWAKSSN